MLKKILAFILGILFTAITAYSLFICMVAGIEPLQEEEIVAYLIKAGIFSVILPVCIYAFGALAWHYSRLYEQKNEELKKLEAEVDAYQTFIQYKKEIVVKNKKIRPLSVPQLSAALEKGQLSEDEVKKLLEYLEEL